MVSARGSNLPAIGTYNKTLVLDLIRRSPAGVSRVELARATGLSPQTLTNVTRRLAAEGLIVEAGKVSSGPGKPRTMLELVPESRYAIGVHLDPALITVVLVDLAGEIIAHRELLPGNDSAAEQLQRIAEVAHSLTEIVSDATRVIGIGVAAPGPLDPDRGLLIRPPLLVGWSGARLRDDLSAATRLPALLEKDVTAAMLGELWVTPAGELGDALFLYYGAGVGVGLTIANSPVRGHTSNAGDIAHLIVDPDGAACECGARGCLGVSLDPAALLRAGGVAYDPARDDLRDALRTLDRRALDGDDQARAALDRAANGLARAIVQLDNLLDLTDAIVGGPVWMHLSGYLRPAVARALEATGGVTTIVPIALRDSRLGVDVAAVGAACLVFDAAFAASPSRLLIMA